MCVGVCGGGGWSHIFRLWVTVQTVLLDRLLQSANSEVSEKPGALQQLGPTCPPCLTPRLELVAADITIVFWALVQWRQRY